MRLDRVRAGKTELIRDLPSRRHNSMLADFSFKISRNLLLSLRGGAHELSILYKCTVSRSVYNGNQGRSRFACRDSTIVALAAAVCGQCVHCSNCECSQEFLSFLLVNFWNARCFTFLARIGKQQAGLRPSHHVDGALLWERPWSGSDPRSTGANCCLWVAWVLSILEGCKTGSKSWRFSQFGR